MRKIKSAARRFYLCTCGRMVSLLFLCLVLTVSLGTVAYASGADVSFGYFDNGVRWRLTSSGLLVLSGEGEIPDFSEDASAPWSVYRENIREIRVEEGIVTVGAYAFSGLSAHTVHLPKSLYSIGEGAFSSCIALQKLQIPEGVLYVGRDAFSGCLLLHKLYLPLTLEEIGETAFSSCMVLSELYYPGDEEAFSAIVIAEGNHALSGAEFCPNYKDYSDVLGKALIIFAMVPVMTLAICLYRGWSVRYREEQRMFRRE